MIEVRDVTKSFGSQQVLRGASLDIAKGEAVVIIGRSGGGKSILLKHLIGLLQPDSGVVRVDGEDITRMDERSLLRVRRKYGMLFQMAALFDSLTVEENVGFVLRRQGLEPEAEIRRRVGEALEMVELPGIGHKMPSELSGGMRKRVGLARAIVYRPEIVLYDEPTTGLDPITSREISELMVEISEKYRTSSIIISHDMKCVERTAENVAVLLNGRCHAMGTVEELKRLDDPEVRRFFE